ncbi:MAG TPA: hypothetical protein DHV28_18505 [Ignavibacteriales bacterium]|nr:hypothetical protein [Ignavibacteriales bacterium]
MKQYLILVLFLSCISVIPLKAQYESSRYEKQHHSKFVESHLKRTEAMLLKSFESNNMGIVSGSLQTLRELEQVFPNYEFNSLLDELIKLVKNEKGETQVRILSAIALDGLHSDKGDKSIYEVAKNSKDKSVKDICIALSIESLKNEIANN